MLLLLTARYLNFSYTKLMNGHWKTHSTERPFLCDVCGKDFKTAKQLKSHKVSASSLPPPPPSWVRT